MPRCFCILATLLTLASVAHAAEPDLLPLGKPGDFSLSAPEMDDDVTSGWYIRTTGGMTNVQGRTPNRLPPSDTSLGRVFGVGAGYRFLPWLRADVTMDYGTAVTATTARGSTDLSAISAMANVYWDMFTFANITPYVGAGVGVGQLRFNFKPIFQPAVGEQADNALGWNVTAGLGWAVTPHWTLDVGYRYSSFGSATFHVNGRPIVLDDLATQQLRIGFRYALQ